jgi:hypothetical protein
LRRIRKKLSLAAGFSRFGFAGAASGYKIWGTLDESWQAKYVSIW